MIASIADLVGFLKRFHREWLDDPSLDPALLPEDLPLGLAMIYRELGGLLEIVQGPENDWRAPFATQAAFVPASRIKQVQGMVEFAWENQGNWSARCPIGELDPPVYCNASDAWSEEKRGFVIVCKSLVHFLTTLCLQEAVMSSPRLLALHTDCPPDQLLSIALQPLWVNGYYVTGDPDHHFFISHDENVLVMDCDVSWVGSSLENVAGLVRPGIKVQVIR